MQEKQNSNTVQTPIADRESLFHPFKTPPKTTDHWKDIYIARKSLFGQKHANVQWRNSGLFSQICNNDVYQQGPAGKNTWENIDPLLVNNHQQQVANHIHGCDMLNALK